MDATTLLREQAAEMHRILEDAIGDCSSELLVGRLPGSTINSPGAIYAHTTFSEDGLLNGMIRGMTPVYYAGGWAEKIGIEMPQGSIEPNWDITLDLGVFRQYAAAVHRATDEYLASATDDEMSRIIEPGFTPPMPVRSFIGNVLIWHVATHQGEISALKGVQGVNGLVLTH